MIVITCDLGFGDSGKGTTVDTLARILNSKLIVRYNGGAQAAHNVVLPDGLHHTFSQYGAGFFNGTNTYLSEYVLVEPGSFLNETNHLKFYHPNPSKTVYVHRNCKIITPYHILSNRLREKRRGKNRHGSCGLGIGEVMADTINNNLYLTLNDLIVRNEEKLEQIRIHKTRQFPELNEFTEIIKKELITMWEFPHLITPVDSDWWQTQLKNHHQNIIFEGAQGVLLDQTYGFQPYTTWSDTTTKNADYLTKNYTGKKIKLGIIRTYMTRHGRGPLPTEDKSIPLTDPHNPYNEYQEHMRFGYFDLNLLNYSLQVVNDIDFLVVNHFDQLLKKICVKYQTTGLVYQDKFLLDVLPKPVGILSYGMTHEDKIMCQEFRKCCSPHN